MPSAATLRPGREDGQYRIGRTTAPDARTRALWAEAIRESRAEQGLPPQITDPEALRKVAVLLLAGADEDAA